MRCGVTGFLAGLLAVVLSAAASAAGSDGAGGEGRPNVLLVLCDDLCCAPRC